MKPIYYLLFSLLTLLACTDQQTELEGASHTMRFGVEGVEDTKGAEINTKNIRSMSVFCAHTGTEKYSSSSTCNWMYNAEVKRTPENPEWAVQGDNVNKQWKDEGYHSFFAFAPHLPKELFSASTVPGPPTLTYTVPADFAEQVDLLYSQTTPINCKQMYIGSRPVVFGFRHALAKITFDARKEEIVEDEVTITNIRLSSIINKARYTFTMTEGYTDVKGISRTTESTDISDFSITPNQVLTNESTILLPDDQALFMIDQSFAENNKLIVTYNKGPETGKTITADLLTVTPKGWDFSKAYRYSILVREDKVTITAEVQPWNDQPVDVVVPGTYLNITPLSLSLNKGTAGDIYYSTDGSSVTATYNNGIELTHDSHNKKITFPSTAAVGKYIVTISASAGKLKREVPVEVKYPPYIQIGNLLWATGNLVADGPNDCKIGQPEDGGLYFQRASLIGWTGGVNGDGTGQPSVNPALKQHVKPKDYSGSPSWNSSWQGSNILNEKEGKGDPCEYYLGNGWRLPNLNEWRIGDGSLTLEKPFNCVSGKYMKESIDKPKPRVWFENAGYRNINGYLTYSTYNWLAYYWTIAKDGLNAWSMTLGATPYIQLSASFGTPIRCVKPVGTESGDNNFIAEDGVAAPRIFVQGTGDDAKLMLTKKPTNYASLFQFGGITAWNYDGASPQYSVNNKAWDDSWTSTAEHTVENLRVGKGDPCRLVGYTQQQVKDMLEAGTVPDNNKWKMPEYNYNDPDFPLASSSRPGWTSFSENGITVNGHFFENTTTQTSNFLPAAGVKYSGGSYGQINSEGWYWTITPSDNTSRSGKAITLYHKSVGPADNSMADGMSVRCVRQ